MTPLKFDAWNSLSGWVEKACARLAPWGQRLRGVRQTFRWRSAASEDSRSRDETTEDHSGPHRSGPGWWLLFHIAGAGMYAYTRFAVLTTRREIIDEARLPPEQNAIYCIWHADTLPYFMIFTPLHRPAFMIGDSWKITFLRICGNWLGVREYVFGQSGRGGREAVERVLQCLREGVSTLVTPDGPRGPARKIKRGILHMAARSGVPIVVINFQPTVRWVLTDQWDRKWLLRPWSHVRIRLREPLRVDPTNLDQAEQRLYELLGP